jgi:hypothetical protein
MVKCICCLVVCLSVCIRGLQWRRRLIICCFSVSILYVYIYVSMYVRARQDLVWPPVKIFGHILKERFGHL